MIAFFALLLSTADCRRKKHTTDDTMDDEPNKYQPEFGKVYYPNPKRWLHYIGRERHAVVAFVEKDDRGRQMAGVMEQINEMIDISKCNVVVAETFQIGQIIEDQGITEFPTVCFYKRYMKKWSLKYEGFPSAKSLAKWVSQIIQDIDDEDYEEA